MTEEVLPGDGFTLQSFSLGRPLRRGHLFFRVIGAVVIDYFRDAIGVQFSGPGGVPDGMPAQQLRENGWSRSQHGHVCEGAAAAAAGERLRA